MATRRNPPRKGQSKPKRPTATIDLKASEVKEGNSTPPDANAPISGAGAQTAQPSSSAKPHVAPSATVSGSPKSDEAKSSASQGKPGPLGTTPRTETTNAMTAKGDDKTTVSGAAPTQATSTSKTAASESRKPVTTTSPAQDSSGAKNRSGGFGFGDKSTKTDKRPGEREFQTSQTVTATDNSTANTTTGAGAIPKQTSRSNETKSSTKTFSKRPASPSATKPSSKPASEPSVSGKSDTPPPPPPPTKGGGAGLGSFFSHAVAGVIGALAVLFGAQYFPQLGLKREPMEIKPVSVDQVSGLSDRLAGIEKAMVDRIAAAASDTTNGEAQIKAIDERMQRLETLRQTLDQVAADQKTLSDQTATLQTRFAELPSQPAELSKELTGRMSKLEETIMLLAKTAETSGDNKIPELAALTGRINDFGVQLDSKIGALKRSMDDNVKSRAEALEQRFTYHSDVDTQTNESVETLKAGTKRLSSDLETLKSEAQRLGTQISTVDNAAKAAAEKLAAAQKQIQNSLDSSQKQSEQKLIAAQQKASESLSAAQEKVATIETALSTFSEEVERQLATLTKPEDVKTALTPVTQQVSALNDQVRSVIEREKTRQESTKRIVLALELSNLKRAMERGDPIKEPLAEVKKLAPEDLNLTALENFSEAGTPTTTSLQSSFRNIARSALDAERAPKSDSVLDQFLSGAQSIVRVRRTGRVEGDTAEAVIARMEARLSEGDLAGALAEAAALKGPALEAAAPWIDKLEARVSVDQAMADIEGVLKTSLSAPTTN